MNSSANHIVVDVGNSRLKWGRCDSNGVAATASLLLDDAAAWDAQRAAWGGPRGGRWTVAGVNPPALDRFTAWLTQHGDEWRVIRSHQELPLRVAVPQPEQVGLDRLFDALATRQRPAVVVDAGSAVTVNAVGADGTFLGGAILPGLRLMAQALHQYTAKLPLVAVASPLPSMPATSTEDAMSAGIFAAVAGGVRNLIRQLESDVGKATVYLTGGDGAVLQSAFPEALYWPAMTLEGIRLVALARP